MLAACRYQQKIVSIRLMCQGSVVRIASTAFLKKSASDLQNAKSKSHLLKPEAWNILVMPTPQDKQKLKNHHQKKNDVSWIGFNPNLRPELSSGNESRCHHLRCL